MFPIWKTQEEIDKLREKNVDFKIYGEIIENGIKMFNISFKGMLT